MANKKVTYKEPGSYFSPGMKKAARDWEKANKATTQKPAPKNTGKKK